MAEGAKRPSPSRQLAGSIAAAGVIVVVVILAVTVRLGPTSVAEQEALTERQEQRIEEREQIRKDREDRREEEREGR